ncbi:MAG TPA: hypothetical protein VJV75_03285 [Candidatus Polarisedimenticolia bacterium]|nr:hypothetical protein [Candidatus Polarisedimenticolia bacterium]
MITTTLTNHEESLANRLALHRDAGPALDAGAAMLALRRLCYFRDLLQAGFESTIWPDRSSRTLRNERLALGIDLPELDAVGIWATRCGDGRVSIPFIEFLLDRTRDAARSFGRADRSGEVAALVAPIDEALMAMTPPGRALSPLPRLEEIYLDESEVARLCGAGGVVERLVEKCQEIGLAALPERGAPAA